MIKKVLLAAVAVHFAAAVPAMAQVSAALGQKSADARELLDIAQNRGSVRVIVLFQTPAAAASIAADAAALDAVKAQVAQTQDAIIAQYFGSADAPRDGTGFPRSIRRFSITPGFAVNVNEAELTALAGDARITTVQLDRADKPTLNQVIPLIGMPATYLKNGTGTGYTVAVLDTGVQSNHEFLSGKVIAEACFSNSAGSGNDVSLCPNGAGSQAGPGSASPNVAACVSGASNICTHGTHVAGIVAGFNVSPNGGEPLFGVGKHARIMAIQVFTRFNNDTECGGAGAAPCVRTYNSDQIAALDYVANHRNEAGYQVIATNMSLGGGLTSTTCDNDGRKPVIDTLRALGVATLIASGNDGSKTQIAAPGCISTAVTVGSTTKADVVSNFSNMSNVVDLLAPGGANIGGSCTFGGNNSDIMSSVPNATGATNFYACFAGTSMATPAVAGAYAAIKSACPAASIDSIESALKSTGLSIADTRSGGTFTKPRIRVDQAVAALGCIGSQAATHDYNGDGRSDIVWRDGAGNIQMWLMAGGGSLIGNLSVGTVPPNWTVVGQRDFNASTQSDLLWGDSGGNLALWYMSASTVAGTASLGNVANWAVVGTGDFNGDGYGDILFRNAAGDMAMWLINGGSVASAINMGNLPGNYYVSGVADFDGDGRSDILWRDTAGNVFMWMMNGGTALSVRSLGNVPTAWTAVATGDFNGDGKGDLLWRNTSGAVSMWLMNGSTVASAGDLGVLPANWSVQMTGDFNGDGYSDVVWRENGGNVAVWQMVGTTIGVVASVGNIPTNWAMQTLNAN